MDPETTNAGTSEAMFAVKTEEEQNKIDPFDTKTGNFTDVMVPANEGTKNDSFIGNRDFDKVKTEEEYIGELVLVNPENNLNDCYDESKSVLNEDDVTNDECAKRKRKCEDEAGPSGTSFIAKKASEIAKSIQSPNGCIDDLTKGKAKPVGKMVCTYCDFRCKKSFMLKRHMMCHTGEKPFSCDSCDYRCSRADTLKDHKRIHVEGKPFACEFCDYKCTRAYRLKEHIRTHTGEKPFACDFCDFRCSFSPGLKEHVKIHTGEKPFACEFCDYRCREAAKLKRHIRAHTGEKPFGCELCGFKSSWAHKLKMHMRSHAGEKPYASVV